MKRHKYIFIFLALTTVFSCTKDKGLIKQDSSFDCGTTVTLPLWTDTMTNKLLCGQWKITEINYTSGTGSNHTFDTTYYPNTLLILNQDGSGTYNTTTNITWTFANGHWPKMNITNINSLFPFAVNFINNNVTSTSVESIPWPNNTFHVVTGGGNNTWEQVWISFQRQ